MTAKDEQYRKQLGIMRQYKLLNLKSPKQKQHSHKENFFLSTVLEENSYLRSMTPEKKRPELRRMKSPIFKCNTARALN
jgi:hypothetical protein